MTPLARYGEIVSRQAAERRAHVGALSAHPARTLRVLELARGGLAQRAIAARLGVSVATVNSIVRADRAMQAARNGAA